MTEHDALYAAAAKLVAAWDESQERRQRGVADLVMHDLNPGRKTEAQLQQEAREAIDELRTALTNTRSPVSDGGGK